MIPKKIHYCWFGRKPLPDEVVRYMETWRKYLPDCEIKEWNEDNFDVNQYAYTKEAYFAKKYAFVSDVARLHALVTEGGLYLDTDILVLKKFDEYLWKNKAFVGFEHDKYIGTGVIGAEAGHPLFLNFLETYKKLHFFKTLHFNEETNVHKITKYFLSKGLIANNKMQIIDEVNVFPQHFFCNKDWATGTYYDTENSFSIHDYQSTWCMPTSTIKDKITRKINTLITIIKYRVTYNKVAR